MNSDPKLNLVKAILDHLPYYRIGVTLKEGGVYLVFGLNEPPILNSIVQLVRPLLAHEFELICPSGKDEGLWLGIKVVGFGVDSRGSNNRKIVEEAAKQLEEAACHFYRLAGNNAA